MRKERIYFIGQEDFKQKLDKIQNSNYKWYKLHVDCELPYIEVCYK